jgi:hypothetical protein
LTAETGIHVTFESAIVPNWRDNSIRFTNVRMRRQFEDLPPDQRAAIERTHVRFDMTIASLEVKLSFLRLWQGPHAPPKPNRHPRPAPPALGATASLLLH